MYQVNIGTKLGKFVKRQSQILVFNFSILETQPLDTNTARSLIRSLKFYLLCFTYGFLISGHGFENLRMLHRLLQLKKLLIKFLKYAFKFLILKIPQRIWEFYAYDTISWTQWNDWRQCDKINKKLPKCNFIILYI